jgi:hypothetical protein
MPYGPDALLRRRATAEALIAAGFPVRPATLATMASRGGGPPYRVFGRIPLYRLADALAWAESRLSPPRRSSSEGDSGHPAVPPRPSPPRRRRRTRTPTIIPGEATP